MPFRHKEWHPEVAVTRYGITFVRGSHQRHSVKSEMGFEPTQHGFADRRSTTELLQPARAFPGAARPYGKGMAVVV